MKPWPIPSSTRRRAARWSAAAAGLIAAAAVGVPAASADIVWDAAAERPTDEQWASSCSEPNDFGIAPPNLSTTRITRSSAVKAKGAYSYKFEVHDGDMCGNSGESAPLPERAELGQGNPTRSDGSFDSKLFQQGQDRWISWQLFVPSNFNVNNAGGRGAFQSLGQWKQLGGYGTPVLGMGTQNGMMQLTRSDANDASGGGTDVLGQWPAATGRWIRFTLHVLFSPNASVGYVELFGDPSGTMATLVPKTFTYTMKVDSSGQAIPTHARIGIYRGGDLSGTSNLYYDGYNASTSRAEAEARAWGHDFGAVLPEGATLHEGDYMLSTNEQYKLSVQLDGNVVLYNRSTGAALWSTHTFGYDNVRLAMQLDGNLVVYDGGNVARWRSGTSTSGSDTRLVVQPGGNLVIMNGDTQIWQRSDQP